MVVVILPAYNEGSSIGNLLRDFSETFHPEKISYRIIIVNDGSTDNTVEVVLSFRETIDLDLINHSINRGLSEALKTGLIRAVETSSDKDVIITMDSDHSHLPGLLFRMERMIREGNDVVIASRYQKGAITRGVRYSRKMLSLGASILFKIFFPIKGVRDYTCGYRAYRASLLKSAFRDYGNEFISEPGFSCMVDILLKLKKYNPIINEVPIILRYDQKKSASKMNVKKTIRQTLILLVKRKLGIGIHVQ